MKTYKNALLQKFLIKVSTRTSQLRGTQQHFLPKCIKHFTNQSSFRSVEVRKKGFFCFLSPSCFKIRTFRSFLMKKWIAYAVGSKIWGIISPSESSDDVGCGYEGSVTHSPNTRSQWDCQNKNQIKHHMKEALGNLLQTWQDLAGPLSPLERNQTCLNCLWRRHLKLSTKTCASWMYLDFKTQPWCLQWR